MERIQAAIQKAKERRGETPERPPPPAACAGRPAAPLPAVGPAWAELAPFEPDPRLMARNRIVTFADADPAHVTFDMMRTKLLRAMRPNGWTSVGITSPAAGCGKTTLRINLAFSLAHQADLRTVLVDLDLRRPAVARELGLPGALGGPRAAGRGRSPRPSCATATTWRSAPTRAGGRHSDLLMSAATAQAVAGLKAAFAPDVIIYDLPPMLMSDDAMAFVPHLDCVLLVAGAEKSRLDEVDKCEHDLAEQTNLLGVVLNMCRYMGEDYGYY